MGNVTAESAGPRSETTASWSPGFAAAMTRSSVTNWAAVAVGTTLVATLAVAVAGQASGAQPGLSRGIGPGGAISGIVTDAVTGQTVAQAVVSLIPSASRDIDGRRQFTDLDGRFVFTGLLGGMTYLLDVRKDGFLDGAYGRSQPVGWLGAGITLATEEWFEAANISLWRPAAISGEVTDEDGEPVPGVFVQALSDVLVAGRPRTAAGPVTTTDDRGHYRIGGLPPGRYVVMVPAARLPAAGPQGAAGRAMTERAGGHYPVAPVGTDRPNVTYPTTFSGGARAQAQAARFDVSPGQEQRDVDVQLRLEQSVEVSGRVTGGNGASVRVLRLLQADLEHLGLGMEIASATVTPEGAFAFPSVASGDYVIEAPVAVGSFRIVTPSGRTAYRVWPPAPDAMGTRGSIDLSVRSGPPSVTYQTEYVASQHWAWTPIVVNRQALTDLVVPLTATSTVTGRIVFEDGSGESARNTRLTLSLEPADGDPRLGRPRFAAGSGPTQGDHDFTIDGVMPGVYRLAAEGAGWILKSAVVEGRDYADTPLDLSAGRSLSNLVATFGSDAASLVGTVHTKSTKDPIRAAVILFPAGEGQWADYGLSPRRIKAVLATTAGAYEIAAVPAGDYYAIAVAPEELNAWQAPGFFARASSMATRITLSWGGVKTLNLVRTGAAR